MATVAKINFHLLKKVGATAVSVSFHAFNIKIFQVIGVWKYSHSQSFRVACRLLRAILLQYHGTHHQCPVYYKSLVLCSQDYSQCSSNFNNVASFYTLIGKQNHCVIPLPLGVIRNHAV